MISLANARRVLAGLRGRVHQMYDPWIPPSVDRLPDPPSDETYKEANFVPPISPDTLENVLRRYGIEGKFVDFRIGSQVTTYEVEIPVGTRFNYLLRMRDDIARDLGTPSLRIIKTLRDSGLIGFEIENKVRFTVYFKPLYKNIPSNMVLPVILGEDTYGFAAYEDLTTLPHMLVAGQTGSGKSVFLNTLVATIVSARSPEQVKLAIVDPKRVEFSLYKGDPHFLRIGGQEALVSEVEDARELLNQIVLIMEERFKLLEKVNAKKIQDYNLNASTKLPYIIFIVDEFADLMMMGSKAQAREVESHIVRLAQKARAVGIHVVLATQKPLASIMTSLIKANMPARIAFAVSAGTDSRVILDETGAETLTGRGDMLYRNPNARSDYMRLRRIQGAWLSDKDVEAILGDS